MSTPDPLAGRVVHIMPRLGFIAVCVLLMGCQPQIRKRQYYQSQCLKLHPEVYCVSKALEKYPIKRDK